MGYLGNIWSLFTTGKKRRPHVSSRLERLIERDPTLAEKYAELHKTLDENREGWSELVDKAAEEFKGTKYENLFKK